MSDFSENLAQLQERHPTTPPAEFWEHLRALQKVCYETSKASGFHNLDSEMVEVFNLQVSQRLLLIVSELLEAFDDHRAGEPVNKWYINENGKPCGFPTELADALIRIWDTAQTCGITDLPEVVQAKMLYNTQREYLHGKRF